jgi:hypothetical protein
MSFASGFNLTASVIPVVTFDRAEQPAPSDAWKTSPVTQGGFWYWSGYKFSGLRKGTVID